MGQEKNISGDRYPRQDSFLGKSVEVCFNYDTSCMVRGRVIRSDGEAPGLMIIQLENGWVVRSTECQYRVIS